MPGFHRVALVVPCWLRDVPTCNTTGTAVPTCVDCGIWFSEAGIAQKCIGASFVAAVAPVFDEKPARRAAAGRGAMWSTCIRAG
jgi:hypothetical protein